MIPMVYHELLATHVNKDNIYCYLLQSTDRYWLLVTRFDNQPIFFHNYAYTYFYDWDFQNNKLLATQNHARWNPPTTHPAQHRFFNKNKTDLPKTMLQLLRRAFPNAGATYLQFDYFDHGKQHLHFGTPPWK